MLQHYVITYASAVLMTFIKVTQHLLRELFPPCLEETAKHFLYISPKKSVIEPYILKERHILKHTCAGLGKQLMRNYSFASS